MLAFILLFSFAAKANDLATWLDDLRFNLPPVACMEANRGSLTPQQEVGWCMLSLCGQQGESIEAGKQKIVQAIQAMPDPFGEQYKKEFLGFHQALAIEAADIIKNIDKLEYDLMYDEAWMDTFAQSFRLKPRPPTAYEVILTDWAKATPERAARAKKIGELFSRLRLKYHSHLIKTDGFPTPNLQEIPVYREYFTAEEFTSVKQLMVEQLKDEWSDPAKVKVKAEKLYERDSQICRTSSWLLEQWQGSPKEDAEFMNKAAKALEDLKASIGKKLPNCKISVSTLKVEGMINLGNSFHRRDAAKDYPKELAENRKKLMSFSQDEDFRWKGFLHVNQSLRKNRCSINEFDRKAGVSGGMIELSPYFRHRGVMQVLVHEMTHWISTRWSLPGGLPISNSCKSEIVKLRSCLSEFYPKLTPQETRKFKGDKLATEEDMADFFSYTTIPQRQNFMCRGTALFDLLATNPRYVSHEPDTIADGTITPMIEVVESKQRAHSSAVARIMHQQILQGKNPNSFPYACKKLLERSKGEVKLKDCR